MFYWPNFVASIYFYRLKVDSPYALFTIFMIPMNFTADKLHELFEDRVSVRKVAGSKPGGITRSEIFAGQSYSWKKKTEGKQNVNGTTPNSGPHGPIICELLVSRHRIRKHGILVSYVIQRLKKIFSAFSNLIFMHESMISNFNNHLLLPTRPTSWAFLFMKILLLAIKIVVQIPHT